MARHNLHRLYPAGGVILLLCLLAPGSLAAETTRVFAMTYPAWVVRDHRSLPLSPGLVLKTDDLLRTGKGARLLLQLADGSAIKLGESSRLLIESVSDPAVDKATGFRGKFQLLRGALRFSSSVWQGATAGGEIDMALGGLRARVAGSDIWGRSEAEDDLVCLLAGRIFIDTGEAPPLLMDQAGSFVSRAGERPVAEIRQASRDLLQGWMSQTEIAAADGIAAHDGQWQLVLISLTSLNQAEKMLRRFRERGFPAWRKSVIRDGRTLHRILLPGFVSVEAALNARGPVEALLGIRDAWVWKAPR